MLGGTYDKVLLVNLSNGTTEVEQLGDDVNRLLVGKRGLIAYFLLRDLLVQIEPANF